MILTTGIHSCGQHHYPHHCNCTRVGCVLNPSNRFILATCRAWTSRLHELRTDFVFLVLALTAPISLRRISGSLLVEWFAYHCVAVRGRRLTVSVEQHARGRILANMVPFGIDICSQVPQSQTHIRRLPTRYSISSVSMHDLLHCLLLPIKASTPWMLTSRATLPGKTFSQL